MALKCFVRKMDKKEFVILLKAKGIDAGMVSFDSETNEGYNIRRNQSRWETFVRERGVEYDCIGFPSESDALQHMFDELVSLYSRNEPVKKSDQRGVIK